MENRNVELTEAEWSIMECLWERAPRIGREIIEEMEAKNDWNRSTTLTLLRRLEAKGVVESTSEGIKTFSPLVGRDEVAHYETENLLDRVYKGSLSMLVSAFTKKKALSKDEIEELYAILHKAEENNND
ncbi:MAG: BlaI/MecI/CopY family transcriptional regulator [Lachnospiraceae bacterium]|nr:BlaI/MecI/CopY family transcriptional regulator [Lachnospiraceae bacterium]